MKWSFLLIGKCVTKARNCNQKNVLHMYFELLSGILLIISHRLKYMIVYLHCEYGTSILVFLETPTVHTWKSEDTYKWIAVLES